MDEFLKRLQDHSENLPFPICCTRLFTGRFEFVNTAFAELLGYEMSYFNRENRIAAEIYVKATDRDDWINLIDGNREKLNLFTTEYVRKEGSRRQKLPVVNIAKVVNKDGDPAVLGMIADYSQKWFEQKLQANRLSAYEQVVDKMHTGVHCIDNNGDIIFMNAYERQLLGLSDDRGMSWLSKHPHVCHFSPNPNDYESKRNRVGIKLADGGDNLTEGEYRSFAKPLSVIDSSAQTLPEVVPVTIYDIEVEEADPSQNMRNREIYTVVADAHVPPDLLTLFKEYGPRNPVFEDEGIRVATFIKVQKRFAKEENPNTPGDRLERKKDKDLVFTFANSHFINELKHERSRQGRAFEVQDVTDIIGRSEAEVWPKYAAKYKQADRTVIQNANDEKRKTDPSTNIDVRIEKHRSISGEGETDVQVVKIPLFYSAQSKRFSLQRDRSSEAVGVIGFYWDVGGTPIVNSHEAIREKLRKSVRELYDSWELLNRIPVPVTMKDRQRRFTCANTAYIEDLKSIKDKLIISVNSVFDVIGRTDEELFGQNEAKEYAIDDQDIINRKKKRIVKTEGHGGKRVRVTKTPIERDGKVIGLQVIFWDDKPSIWIDWRPREPILHVIDIQLPVSRHKNWYALDLLLRNLDEVVSRKQIVEEGLIIESDKSSNVEDPNHDLRNLRSNLQRAVDKKWEDNRIKWGVPVLKTEEGGIKLTIDVRKS